MRLPGRRYRDEWLPNFYPSKEVAPDRWLRLSRSGQTIFLSAEEDQQINNLFMAEELYLKLQESGHIVTKQNTARIIEELSRWQTSTHAGPQLHIVTVTKRCNLACSYCHMNPVGVADTEPVSDLSTSTALKIAQFIMETPSQTLSIEFQGGEPFLNVKAIRTVVDEVRRINATKQRKTSFSLVTNMLAVKDVDLRYCADNDIRLSYTMNGPAEVHDHYRKTASGKPTFSSVNKRVAEIREKFPQLISPMPLCVLDAQTIEKIEQIVDFYYDLGFSGMALIRLKPLGFARRNHPLLDAERYIDSYLKGLDYILAKNKKSGRPFSERMAHVALAKIFSKVDVGYVDWRNPCGDVVGAIVYDYDGEILPADEARSMREVFSLGNVHRDTYEEIVARDSSYGTTNASIRDRHSACRECAYNPYCGVMPVIEYSRSGRMEVLPYESEDCLFTRRFLDWIFSKLLSDPLPLMRMIPDFDRVAAGLLSK